MKRRGERCRQPCRCESRAEGKVGAAREGAAEVERRIPLDGDVPEGGEEAEEELAATGESQPSPAAAVATNSRASNIARPYAGPRTTERTRTGAPTTVTNAVTTATFHCTAERGTPGCAKTVAAVPASRSRAAASAITGPSSNKKMAIETCAAIAGRKSVTTDALPAAG